MIVSLAVYIDCFALLLTCWAWFQCALAPTWDVKHLVTPLTQCFLLVRFQCSHLAFVLRVTFPFLLYKYWPFRPFDSITWFQSEKDKIQVCKLWDKQLLIHVWLRYSDLKTAILTKKCMAIQTLCSDSIRMAIHFFVNFDIFKRPAVSCLRLGLQCIYTKLGDFLKLGLHFMTMCTWINSC